LRYTYNLFNHRIKQGRQITDLQSDTRELCFEVLIEEKEGIRLTNKNKETVTLTGKEFSEIVGGTTAKDYQGKKENNDEKQWFSIQMPQEAMLGSYESASLFQMPNKPETAGFSFYIPNTLISEDEESDFNRLIVRLPEDFKITAKNRETGETLNLTAFQLFERCNDTDANEYTGGKKSVEGESGKGWNYFAVSPAAKITDYEERTLFKMPKGDYENFFYYIPNKLVKEDEEKGTLQFSLPDNFTVKLSDNKNGEKVDLNVEQFLKEVCK